MQCPCANNNYEWKNYFVQQTQTAPWLVSEDQDDQLSDGSTDSDTEHDSDSDMSWMSISPITSDEEYDHSSLSSEGGSESDHDSSDDQEEPPASAPSSNHPTLPPSIPQSESLVGSQHGSTSDHSQGKESQGIKRFCCSHKIISV